MDYALIIDRLRPGAKWRQAESYEALLATWEDENAIPTRAEMEAEWLIIESSKDRSSQLQSKRDALAAAWDSQPDFIVGPFQPVYQAANELLDAGKIKAAIQLIKKTDPPKSFDKDESKHFERVKKQFVAGFEDLDV